MTDDQYNENLITLHEERFIWDERSAFIVFTVFAVLTGIAFFFCILRDGGKQVARRQKRDKWASRSALVGLVFWFISFTLMAVYCRRLDINIKHEYYGLMRVTGYSLREYTESYNCGSSSSTSTSTTGTTSSRTCYKRIVAADMGVDWGYAWACPSAPQTQCQEPITSVCKFKICEASRCSDRNTDIATEKAIACAETYYNTASLVDYNNATFDPEFGPSHDKEKNNSNWPSILAYGDCESCSARLSVPSVKRVRRIKISGATFFFAGVCIFLFAIAQLVPWRRAVASRRTLPSVAPQIKTPESVKTQEEVKEIRNDIEVCLDDHGGEVGFSNGIVSTTAATAPH